MSQRTADGELAHHQHHGGAAYVLGQRFQRTRRHILTASAPTRLSPSTCYLPPLSPQAAA
jgi:hypothetical protein